jgi:predicted AlkP superfamily pyrophosphatase or phosphodiesterase
MTSDDKFKTKIDYDKSLTSLACSIEKYFDIIPKHKSLPYIDNLLNEKKPENVILLLCDGLGSRILDKILDKNAYLIKNRKDEIYSVFPPTTAASLNSIKTGLNPSEHGWLGWTGYVPPIKKMITLYKDYEKGKREKDKDFLEIKNKYYYNTKTVTEQITEAGKYLAYELNCYPYNVDRDIDSVFKRILETLKIKGKKYIFSYYPEPDDILHDKGVKSEDAKKEIEKINKKVEEYSKLILENKNTIMIIVADHGHLIVDERIDIKNSEISKYLENPKIFIENRAPAFLVKKGEEENFKKAFNKDFGNQFYLLSKEEILNNKIFGEYNQDSKHELFESSVGDFIALPKDSCNSILLGECDKTNNASFHGGYSDDEIYIPLIVISN